MGCIEPVVRPMSPPSGEDSIPSQAIGLQMPTPRTRKLETFKDNLIRLQAQREYAKYLDVTKPHTQPSVVDLDVSASLIEYYRPVIESFYSKFVYNATLTKIQLVSILEKKLFEAYQALHHQPIINNSWTRYEPKVTLSEGIGLIQCQLGKTVFATIGN